MNEMVNLFVPYEQGQLWFQIRADGARWSWSTVCLPPRLPSELPGYFFSYGDYV